MGIFVKLLMLIGGGFIFGRNLLALAKRKIDPSYSVAWGVFSLFLIVISFVLRLDQLSSFISWRALVGISVAAVVLLMSLYRISLNLSELASRNHELAIQVSLIRQELASHYTQAEAETAAKTGR